MSLKQRAYRVTMMVLVTENSPNSMLSVEMVAKLAFEALASLRKVGEVQ